MSELFTFFIEHWALSLIFILLLLYLINLETQGRLTGNREVTPAELVECLNHKNGQVLDIRPKEAFAASHIIGAEQVDPLDLSKIIKKLYKHKMHPVVICGPDRGRAAHQCASALVKQDFQDVRILQGGMEAWILAGMPTVKE